MLEAIYRVVGRVTTHLGQVKLVRVLFSGEYYTLTVQRFVQTDDSDRVNPHLLHINSAMFRGVYQEVDIFISLRMSNMEGKFGKFL
jgi:hypothetical protein